MVLDMVLFVKGTGMSQFEKLIQRIRNNPKSVRFAEIEKILLALGYELRQPKGGSSHWIFFKAGSQPICIPKHSTYVKECYVKAVMDVLEG